MEKAREFSSWPHHYRARVFYKTPDCARALDDDLTTYRFVRVIRDPYQRAVSSYRHMLATGYCRDEIGRFLGTPLDDQNTLSLETFLDFVAAEDMATTEVHHRIQRHGLEDFVTPAKIINISRQDLFTELNAFEVECGLPHTDFAKVGWVHAVEHNRGAKVGNVRHENVPAKPFTKALAHGGPWPANELFLTDEVKRRIEAIYATDFEAYADHL